MSKDTDVKQFQFRPYHDIAIELRYLGCTYKEICEKLNKNHKKNFADQTVRKWFIKDGILHGRYKDYAQKETDRRRQNMLQQMSKLYDLIPDKYNKLLTGRFERDMYGKLIKEKDKNGNAQSVEKLDSITRQTLKDLCELFGFKLSPDNTNDDTETIMDRFLRRLDEEEVKRKTPKQG